MESWISQGKLLYSGILNQRHKKNITTKEVVLFFVFHLFIVHVSAEE